MGQDSLPEEDGGGQEDGKAEEVGAAVVAVCKTPPVFQPGKEGLDFVTPAIQPLVIMDWLCAAATGRDARRDALPGQHLAGCVPVLPLIPHHRSSRWQVFSTPSAPVKSLHCPSRRWSRRRPPLLPQAPWSLLVMPPWCHQSGGGGGCPLVEAGCRGMGFEGRGINHQDIWLWGIRRLCGIGR